MINIPSHKKGDWWDGMTLTFKDDAGILLPLNGYNFKADFKIKSLGNTVFSFSTLDNSILIPDPLNGKIVFVGKIIDESVSRYISDLQMTPPNGHTKTVTTINWEITQDITK